MLKECLLRKLHPPAAFPACQKTLRAASGPTKVDFFPAAGSRCTSVNNCAAVSTTKMQEPETSRRACVTFTVDSTCGEARSGSLRFQQATRDGHTRQPDAHTLDKLSTRNDAGNDSLKMDGEYDMASGEGCIRTPAFLGYTRRGLPPQLTPDVLDANLPHMPLHVVTTHLWVQTIITPRPQADNIRTAKKPQQVKA